MGDGNFLDIIIFAAIAAFLVLRLRGVLGKRTGHDQPPRYDPFRKDKSEEAGQDKVIPLPDRAAQNAEGEEEVPAPSEEAADADMPPASGVTQVKLADKSFDPDGFLQGAKAAFEMIITAFAQGDARALRPLLSNDVYEDFTSAIKAREDAKETLETTLVGMEEAEIIEAEVQGKTAFVTVKFVSEQVNVTRDEKGKVVDGDESHVASITDIWTFGRNTRSRDPNWTLVATRSSN
ncbi:MAG: Tim44/TimA family putative adaptor protein [Kiloniellales bacterium]|nr:Tim44/TimA family putative adaptor protein [Kiloniellales bacterium]